MRRTCHRVVGRLIFMGFFGTYQFDGSAWAEADPNEPPTGAGPWFWVSVYDSDWAAVSYAPSGSGTGMAFLNATPRAYFEDEAASPPTDVGRESAGLAAWWAAMNPGASDAERESKRAEI